MPMRSVAAIKIVIPGKDFYNSYYDPTIKYNFDHLEFLHQDLTNVPGYNEYIGFRYLEDHLDPHMNLQAPLLPVPLPELHRYGLRVFGHSQLVIRAVAPPSSVHVVFGMFDQAFGGAIKSDGVQFRVYAGNAQGKFDLTWSHLLDPASEARDRIPQAADLPLPANTAGVLLETIPITPGPANESYWSEVQFH
jgi:hypothetical protein